MAEDSDRRYFEEMREYAVLKLTRLGAPANEFEGAKAHFLGRHVAWYFGDPSRTRPDWVLDGPKSFAQFDGSSVDRTDTEYFAALLAILNSLLNAEQGSEEWSELKAKANEVNREILELTRAARIQASKSARAAEHGRKNKGRVGSTKATVIRLAEHCGKLDHREILNAMRNEEEMLDLFHHATNPLPINILRVCDNHRKIYFDRGPRTKEESITFRTLENTVSKVRTSQKKQF